MAKIKIKTNFGYGTAYEKSLLFEYAKKWIGNYDINSVLEYPANNLMGNNNEIFERILHKENCRRMEKYSLTDEKFDLVWCFCEFENDEDSQRFIQDMLSRTNRYILIITQNYKNLGVPIHRIWHILLKREWNHGIISKSSSGNVKKYIDKINNIDIVERGAFDCPWFYFDIYETFSDIKSLFKIVEKKEFEFTITESPFERLSNSIKHVICHHHYLIIKKF